MNEHLSPLLWRGHEPPDYVAVFNWRQRNLLKLRAAIEHGPRLKDGTSVAMFGAKSYYADNPADFVEHWCMTYDPRNAGTKVPTLLPFVPFQRQRELVEFLHALIKGQQSGLIEKARDMGATWIACAFSVWLWLYHPGAAIGWGSRKQDLVDQLGDPKSIFEKIRQTILMLPREFLPAGFVPGKHMTSMRVINPENGSSIVGEVGDNIGRGGRTLIYFKDESAHYEHPESIEAALGDNTNVQVDISSVNGLGNVFHRRAEAAISWSPGMVMEPGNTYKFILDWRDHPQKTEEWHEGRRKKAESDGLIHVFEQEVNRNYSAAVSGVIIPARFVRSCIDAHKLIPGMDVGKWGAAIDPADEGGDKHAAGARKNVVLKYADHWGEGDTGETTRKCVGLFRPYLKTQPRLDVQYDAPGVGAGVKSEANRLAKLPDSDPEKMPKGMKFIAWNGGGHDGHSVLNPDEKVEPDGDANSPINKEFFANVKAQAWWSMRRRCEKTHLIVTAIKAGTTPPVYSVDELVSIDSEALGPAITRQLEKELSQPVRKKDIVSTKITVDKKPPGTISPNLGDMTVMLYFPMPEEGYDWAAAM
jgi:phage terminase large subunit